MDVLAAIALATEHPPMEIKKERIKPTTPIIEPTMWRQINSQIIYQLTVMIIFLYAGPQIFGIEYNLIETPSRTESGTPTYRLLHYTFLFQTFVMMTLFNMWNCRVLPTWTLDVPAGEAEEKEVESATKKYNHLNIFDSCFANWWFIIIFLAELNMTYLMTSYSYFGVIFDSTPLSLAMQLTAVGCGLGTWLVALCVKFMDPKYFVWFTIPEDEDQVKKTRFNKLLSHSSMASEKRTIDSDEESD
jgi:magnesium-transporting ATPase (P-type)